jgi:hypothetical protein
MQAWKKSKPIPFAQCVRNQVYTLPRIDIAGQPIKPPGDFNSGSRAYGDLLSLATARRRLLGHLSSLFVERGPRWNQPYLCLLGPLAAGSSF